MEMSKVCRTCLGEGGDDMTSIMTEVQCAGEDVTISQMIMRYCQVEISTSDKFPKNICGKCVAEAANAFCFKIKCEQAYRMLMQHVIKSDTVLLESGVDVKVEFDNNDSVHQDDGSCNETEDIFPKDDRSEANVTEPNASKIVNNKRDTNMILEPDTYRPANDQIDANLIGSNICKVVNDNGKEVFKCDRCNYLTANINDLKKHIWRHKPFSCNQCPFSTSRAIALKDHLLTHSTPENQSYPCNKCDVVCSTVDELIKHTGTMHTTNYVCHICSFNAKTKPTLINHIRTHNPNKRFKCNLCSYASHAQSSLQNHIRVAHTGERPFKCDKCPYAATNTNALKLHKEKHLPVRNFSCSTCGLRFMRKNQMLKHMVVHSTQKKYSCNLCDFSTVHEGYLRKHHENIHT